MLQIIFSIVSTLTEGGVKGCGHDRDDYSDGYSDDYSDDTQSLCLFMTLHANDEPQDMNICI